MSSSSSLKNCFNSNCKEVLERSRKGWRRRTGEFADLCDRCALAYEEGKFCETFHLDASGWRCCESCGKQIHCGCIVSFHMFVLLDAGGIECITCARKSFILTPNPAWPPPSLFLPVMPERIKDLSTKTWRQMAGSGPVPWRQAPSLFSSSAAQSDLQPRMPFEVHIPSGIDRLVSSERPSASSLEKKKVDDSSARLMNGTLKLGTSETLENGNAGINCGEQANPCVNVPQKLTFSKNDTSGSHYSLAVSSVPPNVANDQTKASGTHAPRPTPPPLIGKQFCGHDGADSSGETQIRNRRPRGDARSRNQLLPRYWPRITDQELQQISGDSNSVITPLFEKMLSASDAGRIGRLVLPKKCAEAYFPPISQPDGLPLKVQDSKGKEWMFQFRFWPNNNSRMYVLEGVTPCIQSMQLQAGDVVTFSRIEPEGKLVMGFRKASIAPPSDQGCETVNASNGVAMNGNINAKKSKPGEVLLTHQLKGHSVSPGFSSINQTIPADQAIPWPKHDKSGCLAKGAKSSFRGKRKNSTLGSKSKRLRIENEDLIELKLTWKQAQGLLRPPPNHLPSVMVIEGFEFEEYEQDAPIIGRPTIFATDHKGEKIQWAQCEDCFKWRKVPPDAFLPSRWTCSENWWDPERSVCSVVQELTAEQLEDLVATSTQAAAKKMKVAKQDPDSVEALEGLDALANLAIQEEGEALPTSSQATTKHPRHRPGCTCIVCIQPPSGKGPKHKQTCTCNVCLTVKRRFQTLLLRREKKQSEKEAETARQNQQPHPHLPEKSPDDETLLCTNTGSSSPNQKMANRDDPEDDPSKMRSTLSPFKGQIDLNIQPERDEELSPGSDSGGVTRLIQDATESYLRQQRLSNSNRNSAGNQAQMNFGNGSIATVSSHGEAEAECSVPLSTNASASTSGTER
ncbi:B3 domain-containing protein Os07g0563300-like [Camellia sinensis]|uniref:B3 domain-containing protein Os07g0563300-like n=1 Tax=Camellia sinensis TaxID=4442 RepID=UPI001036AE1C|nr:B3 domain-containing protein Os07g0563300-like [Camellia sinensis]